MHYWIVVVYHRSRNLNLLVEFRVFQIRIVTELYFDCLVPLVIVKMDQSVFVSRVIWHCLGEFDTDHEIGIVKRNALHLNNVLTICNEETNIKNNRINWVNFKLGYVYIFTFSSQPNRSNKHLINIFSHFNTLCASRFSTKSNCSLQ